MKTLTPQKTTKNKILTIIIGAIPTIIGIILFFYYIDYENFLKTPYSENSEKVEFTIDNGQSSRSIALELKNKELISNDFYFRIYSKLENLETKYQAGNFLIPRNLTPEQIAEILQQANHQDVWVTIPEGLMRNEIAEILQENFSGLEDKSFDKSEFIELSNTPEIAQNLGISIPENKPLEGYLYPDTYRFPQNATAEDVITSLLVNFKNKIIEPNLRTIEDSDYSLYEILILASILERETQNEQDRKMVADILVRRLENNWALEVDATLLYYFGDWQHEITIQDLELDTPYNTRKNPEFTPTPIANPGEQTIKAILQPEENNYWFYISEDDGTLHYSETLDGHNKNIQDYLQ